MALKPDRDVQASDITFFCNDTTASRGGLACLSTVGSGIAMDQSNAVVTYKAVPSGGKPIGILLNDVVNLDLTRQRQNVHKDEVQTGSKVTLMTRGWVVTDQVYPGITVSAGDTAYVQHSGKLANTSLGAAATPAVGMFISSKDEDGYAKVFINLPNV